MAALFAQPESRSVDRRLGNQEKTQKMIPLKLVRVLGGETHLLMFLDELSHVSRGSTVPTRLCSMYKHTRKKALDGRVYFIRTL